MKKKPNILVCPLDWGIGHATRCVPIINELLAQNANVILGASGRSLDFLKKEFPNLLTIDFPGYTFSYPSKGSMAIKMALQAPAILKGINKENDTLTKLIQDYDIDAVFSDNRYGLYSRDIPSIFMTHQVFIQTPPSLKFLNSILLKKNQIFIQNFNECWIPDFSDDQNLSGKLSHNKPLPANYHFIGPLSRFNSKQKHSETEFKYKVLIMLSGPEPQRSILEKIILDQLSKIQIKSAMVCGKPEVIEEEKLNGHIDVFSHLETEKLKKLILESEVIISRPGYSTVMDLVALNKKAIFIPTPGQTEQEYLAKYYMGNGYYYSMEQNNIDINKSIQNYKNYYGISMNYNDSILRERVSKLISNIKKAREV